MWTNIMQNLIFKGLNGEFKIAATTQYITRIKDSTNKLDQGRICGQMQDVSTDKGQVT